MKKTQVTIFFIEKLFVLRFFFIMNVAQYNLTENILINYHLFIYLYIF